jgi:dihydroflavonol-4-reductase
MTALVTGASGLIGANLARDLLARGVAVRAVTRAGSNRAAIDGLGVDLVVADVRTDRGVLERAAEGCSYVFHTALNFTYDPRRQQELDEAALAGTDNVLRAAHAAGVRRVVVTSSSVVFGYSRTPSARDESSGIAAEGGDNAYVRAKIRQHRRALSLGAELGLEVVMVCPTVTVGAHGTNLGPSNGLIVRYLADPFRATYSGGCNLVAAADVAAGHWLAATAGATGAAYLLGSENLEWSDLHRTVAELAGVEAPRMRLNHTMTFLAAAFEEIRAGLSGRAALGNRAESTMTGRYYWYDDARMRALGYSPRPARTALAEALAWLAATPHVSREVRTSLRLHRDVYTARESLR